MSGRGYRDDWRRRRGNRLLRGRAGDRDWPSGSAQIGSLERIDHRTDFKYEDEREERGMNEEVRRTDPNRIRRSGELNLIDRKKLVRVYVRWISMTEERESANANFER